MKQLCGECPQNLSDGFLMKLTKLSCSQSCLPCLSEWSKCNSLPTESRIGALPGLLCEDHSDASSSASPDLVYACWCEQMLDSHEAYPIFGWNVIIIDRISRRPSCTNCEDIFPDDKFHEVVFRRSIEKLMASNVWAFEYVQLNRLSKVHCTALLALILRWDRRSWLCMLLLQQFAAFIFMQSSIIMLQVGIQVQGLFTETHKARFQIAETLDTWV